MPETRKFDAGDTEGIQKLVRDALGETVRPFEPGESGSDKSLSEDPKDQGTSEDSTEYVEFITFPVKF